eukprot:TRINITY_DN7270_c0_g2_i6.p1 TRINITY_DN7270_c0_g2~~TRINITY_DN7270_c0_g2_i6.p1  ORF type:complete len:1024 (+),score=174.73 TRINITY_DN7270_c0_g2_i6:679-3750(+)
MDSMLLPVSLAWGLEMGTQDAGRAILLAAFLISFAFWCMDILVNFNTGVYLQGQLVESHRKIATRYAITWLPFDSMLVSIDLATMITDFGGSTSGTSSGVSALRMLRLIRALRALRLLRVLKMSRLASFMEESAATTGKRWLMLLSAMLKTGLVVLMLTHVLTCTWYWLGTQAGAEGLSSWIEITGAADVSGFLQYLHSLRWIINSPAPSPLASDSSFERVGDILIATVGLIALGTSLSKIAETLAEIRFMNETSERRRWEVRMQLHSENVSLDLMARVMRFVNYRLEKNSVAAVDETLLSPILKRELFVNQRRNILVEHPLLHLAAELFPSLFHTLCESFRKRIWDKNEPLFFVDALPKELLMTVSGTYGYMEGLLCEEEERKEVVLTGVHWFGELCLFVDSFVHRSSLTARTFAESFSLCRKDLIACLSDSAAGTAMFCEYARAFVSSAHRVFNQGLKPDLIQLAKDTCRRSPYYRACYPDPKTTLSTVCICKSHCDNALGEYAKFNSIASVATDRKSRADAEARLKYYSSLPSAKSQAELRHFVDEVLASRVDKQQLSHQLREYLVELHSEHGSHALFGQDNERERGEASCISIVALVSDRYDIFTAPQDPRGRLEHWQWQEMRDIVSWISPQAEELEAVLVLLAIRGLGKAQAMLQQLPRRSRRPEEAVLMLMDDFPNVVPSASLLGHAARKHVVEALSLHELFKLPQMLQGENVPGSISSLQDFISDQQDGIEVLKFYILFLLGFMSGLAGGDGSKFMNFSNAQSIISGIRMLQRLLGNTPASLYWGFLTERAQQLDLPKNSAEDLALVRLACAGRVQNKEAYEALRTAWSVLSSSMRQVLMDHFLADGLQDQAYLLEFLPDCMAQAKANQAVGLSTLFEVLIDLFGSLREAVNSAGKQHIMLIKVDLSEMSEFMGAAQNRFVVQTCISRCKLKAMAGGRMHLEITRRNWDRLADQDSDVTCLAYSVKRLLEKQRCIDDIIENLPQAASVRPGGNYPAKRQLFRTETLDNDILYRLSC